MSATDAEFEYVDEYYDGDDWLSEQDTTAIDSEDDGSGWQEPRQRARPERVPRQVPSPGWPRDARRQVSREAAIALRGWHRPLVGSGRRRAGPQLPGHVPARPVGWLLGDGGQETVGAGPKFSSANR